MSCPDYQAVCLQNHMRNNHVSTTNGGSITNTISLQYNYNINIQHKEQKGGEEGIPGGGGGGGGV